jgi:hypothetical protein
MPAVKIVKANMRIGAFPREHHTSTFRQNRILIQIKCFLGEKRKFDNSQLAPYSGVHDWLSGAAGT